MQRQGGGDTIEPINPNAIITPTQPEDADPVDAAGASIQLQDDAQIDPIIPQGQGQINDPVQPNMDVPYGSPFGTPLGGGAHGEFHELASQGEVQGNPDDARQRLVEVLTEMRNQAGFLQVVGQENPTLYQALNDLVRLVIDMARGNGLSKAEPTASPVDNLANSLRNMHPQHDCKRGDCYFATEALWHMLGGQPAGYVPHVEGSHWFLKSPTGRSVDPTDIVPRVGKPKRLVTSQPSQRAVGLITAVINRGPLQKGLGVGGSVYGPGDTAHKVGRVHLQLPVGTTKGIKIKVRHRNGHTGWRQVQAGMVQGLEPDVPLFAANSHPVSVKRPFDE